MKTYQIENVTKEKIEYANNMIKDNGGKVYKDDSFSISGVKGRYIHGEDNTLIIRIEDKPFLASWSTIEKKLSELFE